MFEKHWSEYWRRRWTLLGYRDQHIIRGTHKYDGCPSAWTAVTWKSPRALDHSLLACLYSGNSLPQLFNSWTLFILCHLPNSAQLNKVPIKISLPLLLYFIVATTVCSYLSLIIMFLCLTPSLHAKPLRSRARLIYSQLACSKILQEQYICK